MKLWLRFLLGAIIGVVLGLYLPESGGDTARFFSGFSTMVINLGRYLLVPLVIFGGAAGTYELRQTRRVATAHLRALLFVLAATAGAITLGTLSVLIISPSRIPPIFQEAVGRDFPSLFDLVLRTFPRNLFRIFSSEGSFLLPFWVLGLLLGLGMTGDADEKSPVFAFIDAVCRIFYRINKLVVDYLAVGLIALGAASLLQIRDVADLGIYSQLLVTLVFNAILIIFGILPLILYFFGGRENPYVWLFGMTAPALAGGISGDSYFALPTLIRAVNENGGIRRRVAGSILPLAATIGRGGSAMVSAASFVVVLRSYTALEITFLQVLWILGVAFALSFLLGAVPGTAVPVALAAMSAAYGQGMEEVYLILQPIFLILISLGTLLDTVLVAFVVQMVGLYERGRRRVDIEEFV